MSIVVEVQLEWKYMPESYIEEPIQIKDEGFELSIADGVALARIDPSFHAENPEIKEYLTGLIESRLHAVQIMAHGDFTLSRPSRSDLRKDGRKNIFLEVESAIMMMATWPADLVIRDKNGNIVSDSKRDRLSKQKWFAEMVLKYRGVDSTLDQMLKSYQMAARDPKNELVHLYEIRDALSARFGKQKNAIKHLNIANKEWDIIGDLANHQPLEEGRHRGEFAGALRPAEKNELEMARRAVSNLMEKYLIYLETG